MGVKTWARKALEITGQGGPAHDDRGNLGSQNGRQGQILSSNLSLTVLLLPLLLLLLLLVLLLLLLFLLLFLLLLLLLLLVLLLQPGESPGARQLGNYKRKVVPEILRSVPTRQYT